MGKIHWSKTAQRNLEEIADYIAHDSPFYAINFIERVLQDIEKLGNFPKIGRIVPEFKKENIREIIFHNYRIVYKTEKDCIFIISLCHGSIDIVRKAKTEN
ncbi:MAG: type II toxin-antitoxin system RelE/ParE family toxin [Candidatus Brocadia sp. AMX2]|uniref:Plasmid stabilization system protein n=1 Tax=Candidatus Brocadia sinica JPN1 TaxID=1197129 RepID=A0ABQ0JZM0_9BACT|nr:MULTISPECIES: type II toxin-antitoxin system RelE/ParE family toxin [Brocadia]KXK25340.1 MAG: hypothetical protein UZ01_03380 [Candidatus Brocadia sinica]MBC6932448.1 type II toxin-antitoxin system RelE/ParE family toxin [Candidatus Brocadia sp.]MBL1170678.1 type II toxin-antitoxin system RelE/ParE family toxin [Candidatus Brocadia sp. AMX1]NOG42092.1 type II toxin-antitoxin system RelE/ParE family toxin [Planctomycetota bacterium]KAA0244859.1 MAG: type II toxin-antitoxin system RelE/ParE f